MRTRVHMLVAVVLAAVLGTAVAQAGPRGKDKPTISKIEKRRADRHFKNGVALYREGKFDEALAEFERAYEIAPHPLVLYNIAAAHRELSNYAEAVAYFEQLLDQGKGVVPRKRLRIARGELDDILARVARVKIVVRSDQPATLIVDGKDLGEIPDGPIILPPGEHQVEVRAEGKQSAERTVRVASGDDLVVDLELQDMVVADPSPAVDRTAAVTGDADLAVSSSAPARRRRLAAHAGFGTNLLRVSDTGVPSVGLGVRLTERIELGIDVMLVAYAAAPSVRVRLLGEALSLHAIAAVPVAFVDGDVSETFVAGAAGLGLRWRLSTAMAIRIESWASYAGAEHGTTLPTFLGGELWF